MSQEPFDFDFGVPARKARGEGDKAVKEAKPHEAVWKRITTVSRPKCTACVAAMEDGGKWSAPEPVVWERDVGVEQTFYCWKHGAPVRTGDGLEGQPKDMVKR